MHGKECDVTHPLEQKMNQLQRKLKARTRRDGAASPGFEQNVAAIRAEMELLSGRIEYARRKAEEGQSDGE